MAEGAGGVGGGGGPSAGAGAAGRAGGGAGPSGPSKAGAAGAAGKTGGAEGAKAANAAKAASAQPKDSFQKAEAAKAADKAQADRAAETAKANARAEAQAQSQKVQETQTAQQTADATRSADAKADAKVAETQQQNLDAQQQTSDEQKAQAAKDQKLAESVAKKVLTEGTKGTNAAPLAKALTLSAAPFAASSEKTANELKELAKNPSVDQATKTAISSVQTVGEGVKLVKNTAEVVNGVSKLARGGSLFLPPGANNVVGAAVFAGDATKALEVWNDPNASWTKTGLATIAAGGSFLSAFDPTGTVGRVGGLIGWGASVARDYVN